MNKINQKGSSKLVVMIVAVFVVLGIGAVAYTIMNQNATLQTVSTMPSADPNATISPADDDKTIEAELNATNEGDIERDLQDLDSEMNSL